MQNTINQRGRENRYESLASFLDRQNQQNNITKCDKMFLTSIVKRQKQIIQDIMCFEQKYSGVLDRDIVGGLYSIYTLLEDQAQSVTLKQ